MHEKKPGHSTVTLRPAGRLDVEPIVALELRSFDFAGERFEVHQVRRVIADSRFISMVAESDGGIVGWVTGFWRDRGREPWGRVYAIAVDPHARGQKLGSRLMHGILVALEKRGTAKIFLEVRADNHAAVSLYRKLGFVDCRSLANYYGTGVTALRMLRITGTSRVASP